MEILMIGVVIGLIPAAIAKSKGYNFILWWIFGTFLFIVALPVALLMKADTAAIEQGKLREGMKKCPFCAELIKLEANVCRYCGRELKPSQATQSNTMQSAIVKEFAEEVSITTPAVQVSPKKLGLIVAVVILAIVGIVVGQVITSVGDSAKATFHSVGDRLTSPSYSTAQVPQFAPTNDAKSSSLSFNLHITRAQIEMYKTQHMGKVPALATFADQMTKATNVDGGTTGANLVYGPYSLGQVPVNPFNGSNTLVAVATAGQVPIGPVGTTAGWQYDASNGKFYPNNDATHWDYANDVPP
jgi:hypothetical protein